eukprot:5849768-Prymnesium_polylepis.1
MTETHTRLRNVSKLVAHFERAKMVLEEEQKLSPKSLYPEDGQAANSEELGDLEDGKGGILGVLGRAISHVTGACSSKVPTVDEAAPRWLHVLLPAELERKEDAESQELKRIIALDSSVRSAVAAICGHSCPSHCTTTIALSPLSAVHLALLLIAPQRCHRSIACMMW